MTRMTQMRWATSMLVLVAALAGDVRAAARADDAVARAIERAVSARMGDGFSVRIADLSSRLARTRKPGDVEASNRASIPTLEARPVPGARLGQPVRFALFEAAGGRRAARVGDAVATVFVSGPAVMTVRAIERGDVLTAEDLMVASDEIGGVPMAPLPTLAAATGAQAVRDMTAGETVTSMVVRIPPAVVSGQVVTTVARVGSITVESTAIAAQRGVLGQVIRLLNPASRRRLRGTVVGPGRVEVLRER
jgi:flagella basal body P-ring formation protein FlgA